MGASHLATLRAKDRSAQYCTRVAMEGVCVPCLLLALVLSASCTDTDCPFTCVLSVREHRCSNPPCSNRGRNTQLPCECVPYVCSAIAAHRCVMLRCRDVRIGSPLKRGISGGQVRQQGATRAAAHVWSVDALCSIAQGQRSVLQAVCRHNTPPHTHTHIYRRFATSHTLSSRNVSLVLFNTHICHGPSLAPPHDVLLRLCMSLHACPRLMGLDHCARACKPRSYEWLTNPTSHTQAKRTNVGIALITTPAVLFLVGGAEWGGAGR